MKEKQKDHIMPVLIRWAFHPILLLGLYMGTVFFRSSLTLSERLLLIPYVAFLLVMLVILLILQSRKGKDVLLTQTDVSRPFLFFLELCLFLLLCLVLYLDQDPTRVQYVLGFFILCLFLTGLEFFLEMSVPVAFYTAWALAFSIWDKRVAVGLLLGLFVLGYAERIHAKRSFLTLFLSSLLAFFVILGTIEL
ncbi:MAG TPA: hypothetical protein VJB91_02965 [Patescibacteria group bacterium]|nr:hypothetical protein [Patescibacteria group bacterium]